ncbi:tetratricopeptide repeat protein [Bacillus sp. FJAT-45350]|uniref:tetratricopeptide repeat protein n=1 Tax=Bacillus sp. FJAT-45350 TaxID=2011014 RepID=UPI000BB77928|nr:tetratricopeptide repeat protein [Bacillus sp. FJAT-45350]
MQQVNKVFELIEAGEVEKGLAMLENIEQDANHDTKYTIAETYFELGHIDKAKNIIDELLMLYPDEGSLYAFAAELLIDLGEEDEAIEMLLEIKEEDPAFLQGQLLLADLYQMQGLDEVAEQKLLFASKLAPEEPIIAYGLGQFYLERGDYNKSIQFFKKVLQSGETFEHVSINLCLAEAYSATGQFEDALGYYEKGLKERTEMSAVFGYAYTAYQLEMFPLAIEQFKIVKEMDHEFSSLYPYLAKAYEAEHFLDKAMTVLEDGLKVDEYNEELYVHAGKLSFKMKDPEKGEDYLRKVIAINPSHFEAVRTLAAYLKHEEKYEDLLELVSHIKDFGETDPLLDWYEASALKEEDDYEKASVIYEEIQSQFQHDPDFLEEYGHFLLEMGERDRAIVELTKALTLDKGRIHISEFITELEQNY